MQDLREVNYDSQGALHKETSNHRALIQISQFATFVLIPLFNSEAFWLHCCYFRFRAVLELSAVKDGQCDFSVTKLKGSPNWNLIIV